MRFERHPKEVRDQTTGGGRTVQAEEIARGKVSAARFVGGRARKPAGIVWNKQGARGRTHNQRGHGLCRKVTDMGLYSGTTGEFRDGENLDLFSFQRMALATVGRTV